MIASLHISERNMPSHSLSPWKRAERPGPGPVCVMTPSAVSSSRFPLSPRPDSVHSTTSSSDSHDSEENYVPMNPNLSSEDSVSSIFSAHLSSSAQPFSQFIHATHPPLFISGKRTPFFFFCFVYILINSILESEEFE